MLALNVPSELIPLIVNRAVELPFTRLTAETVAPASPDKTKSLVCTDAGSTGSLKFTSSVSGPESVNTPVPAGGTVETTVSGSESTRNCPLNADSGELSLARRIDPWPREIVCSPSAADGGLVK